MAPLSKPSHKDVTFEQTCFAAPEAYDAIYKDERVGAVRYRHGIFSVRDDCNNILYSTQIGGPLDGILSMKNRKKYLRKARKRVWKNILAD